MGVHVLVADRYQLDEPLGRGAMGEVWRATDQVLNRPVAVKFLHTDQPGQVAETDAERFRLEAQTAARVNAPHLVGVYDFGSYDGGLYLVMELVDGWSLAQERSLRGTLPPQDAARIAGQTAAGLAAAHRQGVIHRDIKPANVMLTADGTVKITDFGIARFANEAASTLTATGKIAGSAAYLAPERALGRPAQPASDVYSLGCVLYELLTGRPPFIGDTSLALVQQHVDVAPPPPTLLCPDIPAPLAEYVLRLLSKDPARRPTADQAAAWLSNPAEPAGRPTPRQMSPAGPPTPLPLSAHLPRTEGLPAVTRRGAARRPRISPKALLALGGILVSAVAVSVGAVLTTDDSHATSPHPARTRPPASSPATEKPTSAPPPATASSAPVKDDGPDEEDAQKEAENEAEEERTAAEEKQKRQEEEPKKQEEESKKGDD